MNQHERKELMRVILGLSEYYGRPLSETALVMMAEDLEDLPLEDVLRAAKRYRRDPTSRTMPLPAQIRALAGHSANRLPSVDQLQLPPSSDERDGGVEKANEIRRMLAAIPSLSDAIQRRRGNE